MYFAIRDDDTCYFTKPSDLEAAYSFMKDGCVSLSVVPNAVPMHKDSVFPYGQGIDYHEYPIIENGELISYIRKKIEEKRYDILLHGYSHEYLKKKDTWYPEMIWKDYNRIFRELSEGKQCLESNLNCKITVFTAPNNRINKKGISACEKLDMNYSGIIKIHDREIDFNYLRSFFQRYLYKLFYGGSYSGVLHYKNHDELFAHPVHRFNSALKHYYLCKKHNMPFVIYTHYHVLLSDLEERDNVIKLYNFVMNDGAELVGLSELFRIYSQHGKVN